MFRFFQPLIFTVLFFFCHVAVSGQKKISIPEKSILIDGDLSDWNDIELLTKPQSPIAIKAAKDSEFLYFYIWFSDRRSFEDALQFGFTIYAEHIKAPKRGFGVTVPTGLLNELAQFPGARRAFLSDPNWAYEPGNRKLIEQIQTEMPDRALITYRKDKKEKAPSWPVPLAQLAAMDLIFKNDPAIPTASECKIPLKTTKLRQFGADANVNEPIRIGFEIRPPALDEIMMDQDGLNPQMNGMDRVGRNAAGPNQRGFMQGQDQQIQSRQLMMLRMGAFEKWFVIKPEKKTKKT